MTDNTQSQAPILSAELAEAPKHSLPNWSECSRIVENHAFRARAVAGLEGQVLDTPAGPSPTALHRFIHEYDDADPYRSAWFLHRLELVLQEALAAAPAVPAQEQSEGVHWDLLPSYMIDHCEGDTITEEHIQRIVAGMLMDANYLRIAAERRAAQEQAASCPDVLFDGNAVFAEITRKLGKSHGIQPAAMAATLDAVVSLIRAAAPAQKEGAAPVAPHQESEA